jgi:hypothetical protein
MRMGFRVWSGTSRGTSWRLGESRWERLRGRRNFVAMVLV